MSVVLLAVLALPVLGQDPYEAAVAGGTGGCFFESMQGPAAEFLPTGPEVSMITAVAPAPGGRLFAATWQGPSSGTQRGVQLAQLRSDTTLTPISEKVPAWDARNLVVDRTGRTYVLAHRCDPGGPCPLFGDDALLTFNAQGELGPIHVLGTWFTLFEGSAPLDLAADQCTVFLIQNLTEIRRFNVCTGSFLPDFANTAPYESYSLRILPDGGLLVGSHDRTFRYTAAGTLAQTYPVRGSGAIGLIEDGGKAWIAQRCNFDSVQLDLATGAVAPSEPIGLMQPVSMVPYRGWSAALGALQSANVPSLSTAALALLGAVLSFAAFLRLR